MPAAPRWRYSRNEAAAYKLSPTAIGTVVSDGIPVAGAGNLEDPGAEDNYTFTATAGEIVFFESIQQAAAFQNSLRWQLLAPDGKMVF